MSLHLLVPSGLPAPMESSLDQIVVAVQAWANREMGGAGWRSLTASDLAGIRGATGVTFTVPANWSNTTTTGHLKYLRFGRLVVVSFNLGLTPSAVTANIDLILPQFAVVGRSHAIASDNSGNALNVTLGTPADVLAVSTISAGMSVLRFAKLNGATFAGAAQSLTGQIYAEVSDIELAT